MLQASWPPVVERHHWASLIIGVLSRYAAGSIRTPATTACTRSPCMRVVDIHAVGMPTFPTDHYPSWEYYRLGFATDTSPWPLWSRLLWTSWTNREPCCVPVSRNLMGISSRALPPSHGNSRTGDGDLPARWVKCPTLLHCKCISSMEPRFTVCLKFIFS